MNTKHSSSTQFDAIDHPNEQTASPSQCVQRNEVDMSELLLKLEKIEYENQSLKSERAAYRWLFEVLKGYEAYNEKFLCWSGPLKYDYGKLEIIVSVNKVELSEYSVWKQVARRLLSLKPVKLCAIERIVHRPPSGSTMLPFKGTEAEWANVQYVFYKDDYKVIEDYPVDWDWKVGLRWDLSDPMAAAAELYERLATMNNDRI